MKTKHNSLLTLLSVGLFTVVMVAFTMPTVDDGGWKVPDEYENMENPTDGEDEDGIGEDLYKQHCRSCHGREGYGDGTKANELETPMRDLTAPEVQEQSDGALYYKSIIGRDEMPNFEKKIRNEEDRWLVVNYMRTLE